MRSRLFVIALVSLVGSASAALKPLEADFHPIGNKAVAVYKITQQGDLKINLHFPPEWRNTDRRPAIVFFFGGSCATGSPAQFTTTAEYFATRGLVAASAEYRIDSAHHTPPRACAEDAKSAVRWLRMNAPRLGIERSRVIAGGGSSGASIAAFAAYNTTFEPDGEDESISCKPDALVLGSRLN
jgi:acetyl esterase